MFIGAIAVAAAVGTLCFGEVCTKTEGTEIKVAPEVMERPFVWTSNDAKSIVVGVVSKNAEKIDLAAEDLREVKFTARGEVQRGWPSDLRILLKSGDRQWRWTIPARAASQAQSIRVPAGRYTLSLSADRHRTLYRARVDATKPVALGELQLEKLPVVRGMVVDPKGKALERVEILAAEKLCATTDVQGAFQCELQEPFPGEISIEHPGYGRRFVAMQHVPADFDAGRIVLSRGSNLVVHVQRPDEILAREVRVQLMQHIPNKHEAVRVDSAKLEAKEDDLSFSGVAEGKYSIVLAGDGPFERLSVPVEVKEGVDADKTIAIEPFELKGEVLVGETLTEARGGMSDRDQTWESEFTAPDGRFGGPMWQHGIVTSWIEPKGMTGDLVHSPELGDDPSVWRIAIKDRFITGRVFDAETNAAIKDPAIELQFEANDDMRAYLTVRPTDDGTYRIQASRPGTYRIKVSAEGYIVASATEVIPNEGTSKTIDFAMERGTEVVLELVWPNGAAVANAAVLEGFGTDGVNAEHFYSSDAAGRLRLRVRKGDRRTLYVFPQEGSFAVLGLRSGDEARTERITIPSGTATLRVRAADDAGKPVNVPLLLRYNGEFLPFSMWRNIKSVRESDWGRSETVFRPLPPGVYEIWGTRSVEEQRALMAGATGISPVRIGLSTGEETVQITVPARE